MDRTDVFDNNDEERDAREGASSNAVEEEEVEAWSRNEMAQLGQRVTVTALVLGLGERRLLLAPVVELVLAPRTRAVGVIGVVITPLRPLPVPLLPVSVRGRGSVE